MKKLLLTLFILTALVNCEGQTKKLTLLEEKAGKVEIMYNKYIDLEKNDTLYGVYMGFRNEKYSTLIDFQSVTIYDGADMDQFMKDLTSVYNQMKLGEKISMVWSRKIYSLRLSEYFKELELTDEDSNGYTRLTEKHVSKLLLTLKRINFGNDTILPEIKN